MSKELKTILAWMRDYKERTGAQGVVLGLSGGKDSTIVAMLAKMVFGNNVVAVMMPNGVQKDITDSLDIAKKLELVSMVVNIENAFDSIIDESKYAGVYISEKAATNIAPRIRMTVLYGIAQSLGYLVIGTGNYSEYMTGWTTKFGDSACDFNPIQHLTCSQVIKLGKELAKEFDLPVKYIVKSPGDGLTGKTDEDNFGFTYKELDKYLTKGKKGLNADKIQKMIKSSEHKRRMPASIINPLK